MATIKHPKARRENTPRRPANRAGNAPTLREEFGLTRKTFARMTGLSERTLATWEAGRS